MINHFHFLFSQNITILITFVFQLIFGRFVNFNFVHLILDFLMKKIYYKVDLKVWRYYSKDFEIFIANCLVSMRLEYLLNLLYDLLIMICCHLNFKLIKFYQFSFVFCGAMLLFSYLSLIIYNLCSSFS